MCLKDRYDVNLQNRDPGRRFRIVLAILRGIAYFV